MQYDPRSDIMQLEVRLAREMDRRFEALEKKLEGLEENMDKRFDRVEERKRENYIWLLRLVATAILSFIMAGGALGFIQFIFKAVHP